MSNFVVSFSDLAKVNADLIPVKLPGPVITQIDLIVLIFVFDFFKNLSISIINISDIFFFFISLIIVQHYY